MKTQHGFTLTELMITLAVAALLMSMALPNMRYTVLNNRMTSKTNEFIGTLNFARTEAVTRRRVIQVLSTAGSWSKGWKIMDGGNVLRVVEFNDTDIVLTLLGQDSVALNFTSKGQVQELNPNTMPSIQLSVCPKVQNSDAPSGRLIEIGVTGRATLVRTDYPCS